MEHYFFDEFDKTKDSLDCKFCGEIQPRDYLYKYMTKHNRTYMKIMCFDCGLSNNAYLKKNGNIRLYYALNHYMKSLNDRKHRYTPRQVELILKVKQNADKKRNSKV